MASCCVWIRAAVHTLYVRFISVCMFFSLPVHPKNNGILGREYCQEHIVRFLSTYKIVSPSLKELQEDEVVEMDMEMIH
jgi:hypothetical protein